MPVISRCNLLPSRIVMRGICFAALEFILAHILVLEDNKLLQTRIMEILRESDVCSSVRGAGTVAECTALLQESPVDVLLVDLNLPDGSGHDAIKTYRELNPDGASIVISALSDGPSIMNALELGAIGYLHKDDQSFQVVDSIKMALSGQSPMSPSVAYALVCRIQDSSFATNPPKQARASATILTTREIEVLTLISKGLSYIETASILSISVQTVPVHIRNIYKKLQATNRSEAVYEARAIGIIE